jgi:MFS transporter, SET family, sugar efflux transporter
MAGYQETAPPRATERAPRASGRSVAWEAAPLAGTIGAYGILSAFVSSTTSLFLTSAVHAAPLLVGLFFAVRGAVSIVLNQSVGSLSDRLPDRRLLLVLAGAGGTLGGVCLATLRDYAAVLAGGTVFLAIGSVTYSQLFAYAHEFALARRRPATVVTALLRAVFTCAWVIGPPAGLYMMTRYGFGPLYLTVGALWLVTAVLGACLRRLPAAPRPAPAGDGVRGSTRFGAWPALPSPTWLLLGAVIALSVVNQMYAIDVPLYVTRSRHLDAQLIGWMAGLSAAMEIPVIVIAGRLADRIGKQRLLLAAAAGSMVFFCLLPLVTSAALLLALQVLNAAWTSVALSIPMVMLQDESPSGAGTGSALYSSAFMSGGMLAGTLTGVVATVTGFGGVFWVCAILAASAAAMLIARSCSGRQPGEKTALVPEPSPAIKKAHI